jgi:uncharacterized membrane protein
MVLLLLLASMAMFIALIDRISLLQVNRMLAFTAEQGRMAIDEMYLSMQSASRSAETKEYRKTQILQTLSYSGRPQAIQAVNVAMLVEMAKQSDTVIELAAGVGSTVLEMTPLLRVYGVRHPLDEQELKSGIELGDQRTFEQDPKYAIRLVVDIAIKALSPAINDPTTAVQALDQIEDLLLRLGRCHLEKGVYCDDLGAVRLVVPVPTWDDFLRLSLDEIRFCGANSVQVMRRMKALIKNLLTVLTPERHAALKRWDQRLEETIVRTFADAQEKQEASVPDREGLGVGQQTEVLLET